ncbi:MAG: hypothetical protein EB150_09845 [Nitrososphaeria archaeon]|nr:hypothetical protein [Nitrososphaeria archaeon]
MEIVMDFFEEDEIIEIEVVGWEDTVDIEVSDNHLFVANQILTHNSSVNELEHDHSHIAGGISKIQTADNVISILATPAMRERGQYQFQFLKTRSSSGVGSKIIMGYDQETLRIFDLEEGDADVPVKTASDMLADLRRKNNQAATGNSATENKKPDQPSVDPVKSVASLKELTSLIKR